MISVQAEEDGAGGCAAANGRGLRGFSGALCPPVPSPACFSIPRSPFACTALPQHSPGYKGHPRRVCSGQAAGRNGLQVGLQKGAKRSWSLARGLRSGALSSALNREGRNLKVTDSNNTWKRGSKAILTPSISALVVSRFYDLPPRRARCSHGQSQRASTARGQRDGVLGLQGRPDP